MKELFKLLPQLLGMMPDIIKYLKYIPIIMVLAGVGYGVFYWTQNYKDPYKCVNNEVYEQIRMDSDVYVYVGGYCVDNSSAK